MTEWGATVREYYTPPSSNAVNRVDVIFARAACLILCPLPPACCLLRPPLLFCSHVYV